MSMPSNMARGRDIDVVAKGLDMDFEMGLTIDKGRFEGC